MVMYNQCAGETVGSEIADLIARVRAGDQAAAGELVSLVRPIVARIAHSNQSRRATAEDVMQEVFMKLFARLGQYRGDAPFPHWVSRIAVTTCMDHLRAQQRRPELRWADLSEGEVLFLERTRADTGAPLPGHELATRDLLRHLLERLSSDDRQLIVWFELEQKTIADIEALTGGSFDLIKMRLFRARKKLRRLLALLPGFDTGGAAAPARAAPRHRGPGRPATRANPPPARGRAGPVSDADPILATLGEPARG